MSVPPGAILGGLLRLTSFVLSPCFVKVPGTDWVEPTLLWLIISMPTGSRKTTVYQFMRRQFHNIRYSAGCTGINYTCTTLIMSKYRCRSRMALQDATFEKMGVLMAENGGRLLAMFDELTAKIKQARLDTLS